MEGGGSLGLHELIVPLLQGIDSVEINADIEVGGSDQLFNFHISREVQEAMGQKPEVCILAPIINGLDGRKMSKSYGNCIFLDDSTKDVFGKAMSISDSVMKEWYPIFFDSWDEKDHPMKLKKDLAERITDEIWGEGSGKKERDAFEKVFQDKKIPQDLINVKNSSLVDIVASVRKSSRGDARKLILAGGVYKSDMSGNLEKLSPDSTLSDGDILKIGKKDWVKII
jgi:tyrosyl-tRNA synthetase